MGKTATTQHQTTATSPADWANRIVGQDDVAPDQLLANPSNWRIHPKEQQGALRGVLDQVGWVQRVIVNRTTGHLVDGHLRVTLALRHGAPTVPVTYVDLTEAEEHLILATLDPVAALAKMDREQMTALLATVEAQDEATRDLLKALQAEAEKGALRGVGDPDDAPERPEKPVTQEGDLWELGQHRLLCGDSTDAAVLGRLLDGRQAALVFTDPPYGVNVTGKGGHAIAGDISFTVIPLFFESLGRVIGPGAWVYVCGGNNNLLLYAKMFERYFRQLPGLIVWDKCRSVMRHSGYHSCYELVYFTYTEGGGHRWYGSRAGEEAQDIWRISLDPQVERKHVTQKPVALAARAITNSSAPRAIVFDPFCGSGSTLIACEQLGRRCFALEIDPAYADVAVQRWETFTGQKARRAP